MIVDLIVLGPVIISCALAAEPAVVHFPIKKLIRQPELSNLTKRGDENVLSENLFNAQNHYALTCSSGTPAQLFQLVLDTGSSDFWVKSIEDAQCTGFSNYCDPYTTFNVSASSTYTSNNTDFYVLYGDGSRANGTWSQDVFEFGSDVRIKNFNFALATDSTASTPVAGIGLIEGESTYSSDDHVYSNLPVQLKQNGYISHIAYSLWSNSYDSAEGNILFGGIDKGAYEGKMYTFPMVPVEYANVINRLAINVDVFNFIDSEGNATRMSRGEFPIILDSGSTISASPYSSLTKLMNHIKAQFFPQLNSYLMDCEELGKMRSGVGFDFSGVEVIINFEDLAVPLVRNGSQYLCSPGFMESPLPILGDNALRTLYVVYDLENKEIGIAKAKTGTSSSTQYEEISTGIPGEKAPFYASNNVATSRGHKAAETSLIVTDPSKTNGSELVEHSGIITSSIGPGESRPTDESHAMDELSSQQYGQTSYPTSVRVVVGEVPTTTASILRGYTGYTKDRASLTSGSPKHKNHASSLSRPYLWTLSIPVALVAFLLM